MICMLIYDTDLLLFPSPPHTQTNQPSQAQHTPTSLYIHISQQPCCSLRCPWICPSRDWTWRRCGRARPGGSHRPRVCVLVDGWVFEDGVVLALYDRWIEWSEWVADWLSC